MSDEQERIVSELIEEARCAAKEARDAKKTYTMLIRTFAVAIFIAVSSVSVLAWQIVHISNDTEYIRKNAVNTDAFLNLMDTYRANAESLTKLITDPDIKAVVNDFNAKTDAIVNRIISSQTEIIPRGGYTNNNSMAE